MNKTLGLTYDNFITNTNQVLTKVLAMLVNSAGSFVETQELAPGTTSAVFNVPAGLQYHFLVRNIDQNGVQLGADVVSGNFDVIVATTIQIVTAVSVA